MQNSFHKQIRTNVRAENISLQALSLQGAPKSVLQPVEVTLFLVSSHTCTEISTPSQAPPAHTVCLHEDIQGTTVQQAPGSIGQQRWLWALCKKQSSACAASKHSCCGNGISAGQIQVWKAAFHLDSSLPGGLAVHKRPGSTRLQESCSTSALLSQHMDSSH